MGILLWLKRERPSDVCKIVDVRNTLWSMVLILCLSCLTACDNNSLKNNPIGDKQFFMVTDDGDSKDLIPTVKQFFDAYVEMVQPRAEMSVTWDNPKDKFYIFEIKITDVATKAVTSYKLGITVTGKGNAVLTDVWDNNGKHYPAIFSAQIFIAPYKRALDLINKR